MEKVELERILKAPLTTEHRSLVEAFLADLADAIPLVGEVAGLVRMMEAIEKEDAARAFLELGDLFFGFPPIIGDLLDILTPTNTLSYFMKRR